MDESELKEIRFALSLWVCAGEICFALSSQEKTLRVLYKLGKLDFVQLRVAQHKISASQKA